MSELTQGIQKDLKTERRGVAYWLRQPVSKVAVAAVAGGGFLVASATASAVTCTGTSGLTACEWAQDVDFSDVTKAVALLVVGLVTLGLAIFGGRLVIAWASGRRSGL
jgi:hypothetical protein